MDPGTGQFLKVTLMWIAISLAISLTLSILLPFPFDWISIICAFIGLSYFQRKRMLKRMRMNGGYSAAYIYPTFDTSSGRVNYYCMDCGVKHKEASCPNCGSKMKRAGY
jgi:hypothetical protein